MDITTTPELSPAIPLANYHQFDGPVSFHVLSQQSRMCLWGRTGYGKVRINGRSFDVAPFSYFVLPWDSDVRYSIADEGIWRIAGIHVIPWHAPNVELERAVPHTSASGRYDQDMHLHDVPWRQDRPIAGLDQLLHVQLSHDHPLIELSDYIVQHSRSAGRDATILHHCAYALLGEIRNAITAPPPLDPRIRRMQGYIEEHMAARVSVYDLARLIDRTPTQVNRLCQRHLQTSPGHWIAHTKINFACDLLRGSGLPIAEIAARTGYEDPFYFSRLFSRHMGVSPRTYRQQTPPL